MKQDDRHVWGPAAKPDDSDWDEERICKRCGCRRRRYKWDRQEYSYSRGMALYGSKRPDCFGSTPINEQTIDR